jgi:hypothetical protein
MPISVFKEMHQLCALVLTLPSTTLSVKCSFSSLARINDHKHNSMKNDRLNRPGVNGHIKTAT